MIILKIILQAIKITFRILCYICGVLFLIAMVNDIYRFNAVDLSQAVSNMRYLSVIDLLIFAKDNYIDLIYPSGLIAGLPLLGFFWRIGTCGMMDAIDHALANGEYVIVNQAGTVLERGDDGSENALIVFGVYLVFYALLLPLSFIISPVFMVFDFIKLGKQITYLVVDGIF